MSIFADIEKTENGRLMFYIVAGEASGDRHAAGVCKELLDLCPEAQILGVGGPLLKQAGQEQLFDLAAHAVVGLTDVLKNYLKFRQFFYKILHNIEKNNPDVLILVDYPGFNLRLANAVRRKIPDLPIVYYISPQVWAWKKKRVEVMQKVIDKLLVIFEFEKTWFTEHAPSLKIEWVGHPLIDRWRGPAQRDDRAKPSSLLQVALMPGSRQKEIQAHLPILLDIVHNLRTFLPELVFHLLVTDENARRLVQSIVASLKEKQMECDIHVGYQLTHLSRCDLALVASGSATLECCAAGVPMLVIYKVHPLTYWIGKKVVKLPYLSIVNILAGEKIVPEFLQEKAQSEYLTAAILEFVKDPRWLTGMRERLKQVARQLGPSGASRRAAQAIMKVIEQRGEKE